MILRYDKDEAIPYFSYKDFNGLKCEKHKFKNTRGNEIAYFYYNYEKYNKDKIVLFLHGMGPGHTAYMTEINGICKKGYMVLTLDYTGCGESDGETIISLNEPTRDAVELLDHLKLKEEIVVVGHSVGAYTTLNVVHLREEIKKAVIISGFISLKDELKNTLKLNIAVNPIMRYEKNAEIDYYGIDNSEYLKTTTDKLLFIHSKDDKRVKFKPVAKKIKKANNPNTTLLEVDKKNHNPTYTEKAVNYLSYCLDGYMKLVKKKASLEERKKYMKDKSIYKMTEQDRKVMKVITDFIG